jgi:DNA-binding NarL/FixJ family response regulator
MALLDARKRVVVEVNEALAALGGMAIEDARGMKLDDIVDVARLRAPRLSWDMLKGEDDYLGETAITSAAGGHLRLHYAARGTVVDSRQLILVVISEVERDEPRVEGRPSAPLTAREREIVNLVALGLTSREISERLHVSNETVRRHVHNAMGKLGARTRAQLVAIAMTDHIIDDGRV